MRSNAELIQQLVHYKRKYFINKALKGAILFISLLLVAFLLVNTIEFSARLNSLYFVLWGCVLPLRDTPLVVFEECKQEPESP